MDIDKYKIIKILGRGMIGTIYLVEKNNKRYALKIEKRLLNDIKNHKNSPVWNDIEFSKKMGNKYPDQFLKLYAYDWIKDCKHVQKFNKTDLKFIPEKYKKQILKIQTSEYCSRRIYSLIDTTYEKIRTNLSKEEGLSALAQSTYATYLMHKNGYVHRDLHVGNIGIVETKKKHIKILNKNIPTYNKIYKIIDYGMVRHKRYLTKKKFEEDKYEDVYWLIYLIGKWEFWRKHWKKAISGKEIDKKIEKHQKFNKLSILSNDKKAQLVLFEILYPTEFQKIALGKHYKKTITDTFYLDLPYIIYFVNNMNDSKKVLDMLLTHY